MESTSLSSLDNLTLAGLRGGVDMRPTLIRVLTDLYVQKLAHTPDEERHYTELALRLLDAVDVPTRVSVAGRLARHLSPPLRVVQQLAADLPEVATVVRGHAVLQARQTMAAPVQPATPVPAAPETAREESVLHEAADADTLEEALEDQTSPVENFHLMSAAVASELNELFFAASAVERRLILLNLDIAAPIPADRIQFQRDAGIAQRLEGAALARKREDFAEHLAQALQISRAQARRIAGDELGEPIVAAAKALALPRDIVYRMLLFINTTIGHSVERVHTLATLYDEIPAQAAEHMVAIWQSLQHRERRVARYRPLFWNDEARNRARTASVTVRRAPATQRPGERRDAS